MRKSYVELQVTQAVRSRLAKALRTDSALSLQWSSQQCTTAVGFTGFTFGSGNVPGKSVVH